MPLMDAALNTGANAIATAYPYLSLHSATPNTSGSNETSAGRLAAGWGAASGGDISIGAAKNFTGGAANGAVNSVGMWTAATGGTFGGYFAITGDASFNNIEIGNDASTLTKAGVKGPAGVFSQQADTVHIDNLRPTNYATTAGVFKLPGLKLRFSDSGC